MFTEIRVEIQSVLFDFLYYFQGKNVKQYKVTFPCEVYATIPYKKRNNLPMMKREFGHVK